MIMRINSAASLAHASCRVWKPLHSSEYNSLCTVFQLFDDELRVVPGTLLLSLIIAELHSREAYAAVINRASSSVNTSSKSVLSYIGAGALVQGFCRPLTCASTHAAGLGIKQKITEQKVFAPNSEKESFAHHADSAAVCPRHRLTSS